MLLIGSCQAYFRLGQVVLQSIMAGDRELVWSVFCWQGRRPPAVALDKAARDLLLLLFIFVCLFKKYLFI